VLPTQASQPCKQRSPKKREVIVPVENTDCDEDFEEDSDSEEPLLTNRESDAISTDVSSKDSLVTECERLKKELEKIQAT